MMSPTRTDPEGRTCILEAIGERRRVVPKGVHPLRVFRCNGMAAAVECGLFSKVAPRIDVEPELLDLDLDEQVEVISEAALVDRYIEEGFVEYSDGRQATYDPVTHTITIVGKVDG